MTQSNPLIQTEHAAFGYGRKNVLEDVNLAILSGEVFGIAGPNGAGKSTLLRGLLGLLRPRSGKVSLPECAVGYTPQTETLDPLYPLSVLEVVCMGSFGRLRGLRRVTAEGRTFAQQCLMRVGLINSDSHPYAQLSGGQRQRVLIARALMVRPKLLLLDEPTSGVDEQAAEAALSLLNEFAERDGMGIVLVSHQLHLLHAHCDRVAWVADGRVQVGPPQEILRPIATSGFQGPAPS